MSFDDIKYIHIRFENDKIIEGQKLFERVSLICTINDTNNKVEIPIIKIPILRDRVKPYLKERGILVPSIAMKTILGLSSRKKQKERIRTLIQMINENINESQDLKEVVLKFLELNTKFTKFTKSNSNASLQSTTPISPRGNGLPRIISRNDSVDVLSALQSDWLINYNDLVLIRQAGHGAFGQIYKARYRGIYVALKQFSVSEVSKDLLKEMKYEVSILSSLRHPNIVLYIGASLVLPNIGMVTEWCENGSLADYLHDFNKPLFGQRCVQLALEISQGMEYLQGHHNHIIHRDLKSDNILLGKHYEAKVADFGLTVIKEEASVDQVVTRSDQPDGKHDQQRISLRNMLTNPILINGDYMTEDEGDFYGQEGTLQWMAPEIMNGSKYNNRVDIYSYGIVLTELLSRRIPFSDKYTGFDFINDVISNNAIPTIPEWVNCYEQDDLYKEGWTLLKTYKPDLEYSNIANNIAILVRQCTIMNARFRPSFKTITDTLLELTEQSPLLFLHTFDIPRIRWGIQQPYYQELALHELVILLTHILVPCSSCTQFMYQEHAIYEDYIDIFVPELIHLVSLIIHKEIETEFKGGFNSLLSLAIQAELILFRFFCSPSLSTLSQLIKDIVFILAYCPIQLEEGCNEVKSEQTSPLTLSDICNLCLIINMCWTITQEIDFKENQFKSIIQEALEPIKSLDFVYRERLFYRLVDWIPRDFLEGEIITKDEIDESKLNNQYKKEKISQAVRYHIILLQNKFQLHLLKKKN